MRALLAAALALGAAGPAAGYTVSAQKWPASAMPVQYWIDSAGSSPDITNGSDVQAVKDAFSDWERVACAFITFRYMGVRTTISSNDSFNVIKWIGSGWQYGSSTLGVTTPVYWSTGPQAGQIFDADIVFNNRDHDWDTASTNSSQYRTDVKSIALHEEGHLLGLNHSQYSSAVMAPSYAGFVTDRLTQDDINGACAIYPVTQQGTGQQGDPCTSVTNCISSLGCAGPPDNSFKICTKMCPSASPTCPTNYTCQASGAGENACLPPPAQSGNGGLCDSCQDAGDCASGLCYTDGTLSICTQSCNTTSSPCPGGYTCDPVGSISICWPGANSCGGTSDCTVGGFQCPSGQTCNTGTKTCQVTTVPLDGFCDPEVCASGLLCVGADSVTAKCRQACTTIGATAGCPANHTCRALSSGGGACLPTSGSGGAVQACGACSQTVGCISDTSCISWSLQDASTATVNFPALCRRDCDPADPSTCPVGVCLDFGSSAWCACPGEVAEYGENCDSAYCAGGLIEVDDGTGQCICRWKCDPNNPACAADQECQGLSGETFGVCWPVPPRPDAGPDAGPLDSGPRDSGPLDSGPADSGPRDSGPVDSGPRDSGPADSGPVDSGPRPDAGIDAGAQDAGPVDSGPVTQDSGPGDSGPSDGGIIITTGDAGTESEDVDAGAPRRDFTVPRDDGGGCACAPGGGSAPAWPLLFAGLVLLAGRRKVRKKILAP